MYIRGRVVGHEPSSAGQRGHRGDFVEDPQVQVLVNSGAETSFKSPVRLPCPGHHDLVADRGRAVEQSFAAGGLELGTESFDLARYLAWTERSDPAR